MDNLNAQLQAMKVQNQTASADLPLDFQFNTKGKTKGKQLRSAKPLRFM